jgi:hypothetical protein
VHPATATCRTNQNRLSNGKCDQGQANKKPNQVQSPNAGILPSQGLLAVGHFLGRCAALVRSVVGFLSAFFCRRAAFLASKWQIYRPWACRFFSKDQCLWAHRCRRRGASIMTSLAYRFFRNADLFSPGGGLALGFLGRQMAGHRPNKMIEGVFPRGATRRGLVRGNFVFAG